GALVRLIAGDVGGHSGPGSTYTPIAVVHATLQAGAELQLPWRSDFNALLYVLSGRGSAGAERAPIRAGQLAVFGSGATITVCAGDNQDPGTPELDVIILGGAPIREPVAMYGPFVMNTRAEIVQAFEDYQSGRFAQPTAGSRT
ncbi:MAG: pirin family protein, partial [Geodermatophilaceae bacterium]|nr:pirin family protein [Geodermatophilaceae bacterium]